MTQVFELQFTDNNRSISVCKYTVSVAYLIVYNLKISEPIIVIFGIQSPDSF